MDPSSCSSLEPSDDQCADHSGVASEKQPASDAELSTRETASAGSGAAGLTADSCAGSSSDAGGPGGPAAGRTHASQGDAGKPARGCSGGGGTSEVRPPLLGGPCALCAPLRTSCSSPMLRALSFRSAGVRLSLKTCLPASRSSFQLYRSPRSLRRAKPRSRYKRHRSASSSHEKGTRCCFPPCARRAPSSPPESGGSLPSLVPWAGLPDIGRNGKVAAAGDACVQGSSRDEEAVLIVDGGVRAAGKPRATGDACAPGKASTAGERPAGERPAGERPAETELGEARGGAPG